MGRNVDGGPVTERVDADGGINPITLSYYRSSNCKECDKRINKIRRGKGTWIDKMKENKALLDRIERDIRVDVSDKPTKSDIDPD